MAHAGIATYSPTRAQAIPPGAVWLELVDFKWLMAGQGWWIDLWQLQRDPAYAQDCLKRGEASNVAPLRDACRRLHLLLDAPPAEEADDAIHV